MQRRLFDDRAHVRAAPPGRRRRREQQRPAARDHDALAIDRHAALEQRLQAARAGDARQRPAVERQQTLARAGRQDQLRVFDAGGRVAGFEQQASPPSGGNHLRTVHRREIRARRGIGEPVRQRLGRHDARTLPPDLPARARIVVDERDARALLDGHLRRPQARRPRADHDDVIALDLHRAVSITRPSRHSVWQASTCARASIVTRHSWHTPIPHSAPRGSPVTERRAVSVPCDRERGGDGRERRNADDLPVDRHGNQVSHRACSIEKRRGENAAPSSAQSCLSICAASSLAVPSEVVTPSPSWPAASQMPSAQPCAGADQRQAVRRRGAKAGPRANAR